MKLLLKVCTFHHGAPDPTAGLHRDPVHQGNSQQLLEHPLTNHQARSRPCSGKTPESLVQPRRRRRRKEEGKLKSNHTSFPSSPAPRNPLENNHADQGRRGGWREEKHPRKATPSTLYWRQNLLDANSKCHAWPTTCSMLNVGMHVYNSENRNC